MIATLRFTLELHAIWILLIIAAGPLTLFGIPALATVLLFYAFLYRLNVEDKTRGTWAFFQASPINFYEKVVVRILLPLLLCFYVAVFTSQQFDPLMLYVRDDFRWSLLSGALLVMTSVIARSLVSYLVLSLAALVLASVLRHVGSLDSAMGVVSVGISLYFLSEKRLSARMLTVGTFCIALPAWLGTLALDKTILSHLLTSRAEKTQMEAAIWLAVRDDNDEGRKYFEKKLKTVADLKQLKTLLESLDRAAKPLSMTAQDWRDVGLRVPEGKGEVLGYLMDHGPEYPWWSADAMIDWESLVLTGDKTCDGACELLADIMISHWDDEFDFDRLIPLLAKTATGDETEYALHILEASDKPELVEHLRDLRGNPRAKALLQKWSAR